VAFAIRGLDLLVPGEDTVLIKSLQVDLKMNQVTYSMLLSKVYKYVILYISHIYGTNATYAIKTLLHQKIVNK
jgi:hypothetical protein